MSSISVRFAHVELEPTVILRPRSAAVRDIKTSEGEPDPFRQMETHKKEKEKENSIKFGRILMVFFATLPFNDIRLDPKIYLYFASQ